MTTKAGSDQGECLSLNRVKKVSAWGVASLRSQSPSRVRKHLCGGGGGGKDGRLVTCREVNKRIILRIMGEWFVAIGKKRHKYRMEKTRIKPVPLD